MPADEKPKLDPKKNIVLQQEIARKRIADMKAAKEHRAKNPLIDPLSDVVITGNTEIDDQAEIEGISQVLKKTAGALAADQDQAYWTCLVFQSQAQMRAFLHKTGFDRFLDSSNIYVDGTLVAKAMGIDLPDHLRDHSKRGADKRLVSEIGIKEYGK